MVLRNCAASFLIIHVGECQIGERIVEFYKCILFHALVRYRSTLIIDYCQLKIAICQGPSFGSR